MGIYESQTPASDAVGSIKPHAAAAGPAGHLKCDGAAISRTAYTALFAAIGTLYGAGDGSTTFNIPDLRGEFIRGFDDGAGVDSGRVFGTSQDSDIMSHSHSGVQPQNSQKYGINAGNGTSTYLGHCNSTVVTTGATGGAETRPRNLAMSYWIKF